MPRCLLVQHVAAERGYAIDEALQHAGVTVDTRRVFAGDPLPPDLGEHEGLVVMGGPMSAASDEGFPTRLAEISLLREAMHSRRPTLGVCLGAQLLALASDGSVRPGEAGPEVGWGPVTITPGGQSDQLFTGLPSDLDVLQWHSDTFDVPDAVVLASNAIYANQAVRVGPCAWGLQFHVEVDTEAVEAFLAAFGHEADAAPGGSRLLRSSTPEAVQRLTPFRALLLGRFAELVATTVPKPDLVAFD